MKRRVRSGISVLALVLAVIGLAGLRDDLRGWAGVQNAHPWMFYVVLLVAVTLGAVLVRQWMRDREEDAPAPAGNTGQRVAIDASDDSSVVIGDLRIRNHDVAVQTTDRADVRAGRADIE